MSALDFLWSPAWLTHQERGQLAALVVAAWFFFELTGYAADHCSKVNCRTLAAELDAMEKRGLIFSELLVGSESLIATRNERMRLARDHNWQAELGPIRDALGPRIQTRVVLEFLVGLFDYQLSAAQRAKKHNFRVGFYILQNGHMVPVAGYDLSRKKADPFSAPTAPATRHHFAIDNTVSPSFVVRCLRAEECLIVSDCTHSSDFEYFREEQRTYIRSIIGYPFDSFLDAENGRPDAVIVVDTTVEGFFKEESRLELERTMAFIARCLDHEYLMSLVLGV